MARLANSHCTLFAVSISLLFGGVLLSGCATGPKTQIAAPEFRATAVSEAECARSFRRADDWVENMADYDRGSWQVRKSRDIARFDTSLFEKWHTPKHGYNAQWWIYTKGQHFGELTPHILNYDLLGDIYYRGCESAGIERDFVMAAKHYEFAALGHVAASQRKLGKMLLEGEGIQADKDMGIKWLTSAALEGDQAARSQLSDLGLEIPAPTAPNTFAEMARHERSLKQGYARTMQARAQQRRQNVGQLFSVAIVAVGAYYALESQPAPRTAQRARNKYQPVTVQRTRPVFCTSNIDISAFGGSYSGYASGTVSTFCN